MTVPVVRPWCAICKSGGRPWFRRQQCVVGTDEKLGGRNVWTWSGNRWIWGRGYALVSQWGAPWRSGYSDWSAVILWILFPTILLLQSPGSVLIPPGHWRRPEPITSKSTVITIIVQGEIVQPLSSQAPIAECDSPLYPIDSIALLSAMLAGKFLLITVYAGHWSKLENKKIGLFLVLG